MEPFLSPPLTPGLREVAPAPGSWPQGRSPQQPEGPEQARSCPALGTAGLRQSTGPGHSCGLFPRNQSRTQPSLPREGAASRTPGCRGDTGDSAAALCPPLSAPHTCCGVGLFLGKPAMISRRPGPGHGAAHLHLPVPAPGGQQGSRVDSRGKCQADRLGRGLSGGQELGLYTKPASRQDYRVLVKAGGPPGEAHSDS